LIALLASVIRRSIRHAPPQQMRQHPIAPGAFKFSRIQPTNQSKPSERGLLETGPAVSRRDRIHDRPEPLDRDPRLIAGKST